MDAPSGRTHRIRALAGLCGLVQIVGLIAVASAAEADVPVAAVAEPEGSVRDTDPSAPPLQADQSTTSSSTTIPPSTTTAPPSTTTAPPSTTTAPPSTTTPAPPPPPAAAPQPAPPAPAPVASGVARVEARHRAVVPANWRQALPVRFEIVPGSASWAWPDGRIEIARSHAASSDSHLGVIIAHEFGHVIAFRYGSGAYNGAAPAGWPEATHNPAEHWADCVQQVFTGTVDPSHGLPACGGPQLAWAQHYLASGPPRG